MSPGGRALFGLFGAGGFAREVMPLARDSAAAFAESAGAEGAEICFVEPTPGTALVNGVRVISEAEYFAAPHAHKAFNVAIADPRIRAAIAAKCIASGARPATLRAANSIAYDGNEIGEGAIFCAFSMVTSNARIGRYFHANIYAYVAHDCVIGDYVTFGPNVHCNGHVHVGDRAYVGTGVIIRHGTAERPLVIGEGAVVGMGSVVTRDVAPGTTVIGNPARVVEA